MGKVNKRFTKNTTGAVLPVFAAAVPVILLSIGFAVDYSRSENGRTELQTVADAAALAAAHDMVEARRERRIDGRRNLNSNTRKQKFVKISKVTVTPQANGAHVKAEGYTRNWFMGVFGKPYSGLTAESFVRVGQTSYEMALVLDVSGSMLRDGRMDALRTAATGLIDRLADHGSNLLDGHISIVPYKGAVNVGAEYTDWLTGYRPSDYSPSSWSGCVDSRPAPFDQTDTPPGDEPFRAYFWPSGRVSGTITNNWPAVDSEHGPNLSCHPNKVIPLTNDRDVLVDAIKNLDADNASAGAEGGGTNHPTGLVWGWRTISPKWKGLWKGDTPANLPSAASSGLEKVIVMMTDGEPSFPADTRTSYGFRDEERLGVGSQSARMLERTQAICNEAKKSGVKIYTIVFAESDVATNNAFRECASSPDMYFSAATSEDIINAFHSITAGGVDLHVAQ